MTLALFDDAPEPAPKKRSAAAAVLPAYVSPEIHGLAKELPESLHLGTSSWHFPGWAGIVWDQPYAEPKLSKDGLRAYSQHPLLRTVSLDRAFYRPMTVPQYAQLAAQVDDDFSFLVKVPSMISDALIRSSDGENAGRGLQANPHFLAAALFQQACLQPVIEGLGRKLGALVLQMSPLPASMLHSTAICELFEALAGIFSAWNAMKSGVSESVLAIEIRNPELIQMPYRDDLIALLKAHGITYCLAGHAKMPPLEEQLPILRKLWPGPLVCRWNLHAKHGKYGYEAAKSSYEPFDRLVDEDLATREVLSRVIAGTIKGGQVALVTINNKAEGSAPLSVRKLAQAVAQKLAAS
ncbi:MAG: DUF72 domain-containing protein [Brachymonas sp.]